MPAGILREKTIGKCTRGGLNDCIHAICGMTGKAEWFSSEQGIECSAALPFGFD